MRLSRWDCLSHVVLRFFIALLLKSNSNSCEMLWRRLSTSRDALASFSCIRMQHASFWMRITSIVWLFIALQLESNYNYCEMSRRALSTSRDVLKPFSCFLTVQPRCYCKRSHTYLHFPWHFHFLQDILSSDFKIVTSTSRDVLEYISQVATKNCVSCFRFHSEFLYIHDIWNNFWQHFSRFWHFSLKTSHYVVWNLFDVFFTVTSRTHLEMCSQTLGRFLLLMVSLVTFDAPCEHHFHLSTSTTSRDVLEALWCFLEKHDAKYQVPWAHLEMCSQTVGRFFLLMVSLVMFAAPSEHHFDLKYVDHISRCAWGTLVFSRETRCKVPNTLSTSRDVLTDFGKILSPPVGLAILDTAWRTILAYLRRPHLEMCSPTFGLFFY